MKKTAFTLLCLSACLALSTGGLLAQDRQQTVNIGFPPAAFQQNGGPIINIKNSTLFSPNAVGDGVTDDTAAFKALVNYLKDRVNTIRNGGYEGEHGLTVYMPSGTYLVSDTIIHDGSISRGFCYLRMVGQNRANTTIRLKNNSAGFGAGQQKPVITWTKYWEDYQGNIMWGNQLKNITIDTGTGNPGAVGMAFFGANGCSIENVTIRSGDGNGQTGLLFPGWSVQGHFTDITVDGFDYGIRLTDKRETNPAFENITLKNQKILGMLTGPALVSVRKLLSQNSVPAISVNGAGSQTVVVDSRLEGGATGQPAVRTIAPSQMDLFMRNVQVAGYGSAINVNNGAQIITGNITEWLSGTVFSVGTNTPAQTMNLPVEEVKLAPWDLNPSDWANPDDYSHLQYDDHRINAALNSGKPGIYFPRRFVMQDTNVMMNIPAHVRQMDFMNQNHLIWGRFRVSESSSQPLFVENLGGRPRFTVAAKRDVYARNGGMYIRTTTTEDVSLHLQNISPLQEGFRDDFCPSNVRIYGRNINEESSHSTNFKVNGGFLWALGFKLERPYIGFHVVNGGFLEVLGGYQNFAGSEDIGLPVVRNEDSNVSYIGSTHMSRTYWEGIWEIRNGVTTKIRNTDFPRRATFHSGNYTVPLYVGYDPSAIPAEGGVLREYWTGISGTSIASLTSQTAYPASPTGSDTLSSLQAVHWANPSQTSNWADNYGQRIRGYITAPQSGTYTFWISGDDDCQLWLSTSGDPAQKQLIAQVNGWTGPLEWNKFSSQKSGAITLSAGQTYYVEVLHKEGGGGDSLAVGWLKPGQTGTTPSEIVPGSVLTPFEPGPGGPGGPGGGSALLTEGFDAGSAITNQTQLSQVFLINNLSGNQWNHGTSGGVGGSGTVYAPSGQNASMVHNTPVAGFATNPSLKLSFDAYINHRTTNEPTFGISHWAFLKNTLSAGNEGLVVELRYIPPASRTAQDPERFRLLANGVKIGVPALTAGAWAGFDLTWTRTASGTFDIVVEVSGLGPAGTSAPTSLGTYTRQGISHATMASATQVYGGLQGRAASDTGVFRIDNFQVSGPGSGSGALTAVATETFEPGSTVTNQTQLEQRFVINDLSGNKWWHSTTGGVNNGGRMMAPSGQNASAVHNTAMPGFANKSKVGLSMDTWVNHRTTNEPGFGISWWAFVKGSATSWADGLMVELQYVPPASRTAQDPERFRVLANGQKIGTPNLPQGQWVGWDITWNKNAQGTFDLQIDLFSLGANGTSTPSLLGTYTRNAIINSALASSTQVFGGIQGRASTDTGVFRVDNFMTATD